MDNTVDRETNRDLIASDLPQKNAARDFGWVISTVWLLFLCFPVASLWTGELSTSTKVVGTLLIVLFGATYIAGFIKVERLEEDENTHPYFVTLVLVAVAVAFTTDLLIGLSLTPYLVPFAMFTLPWAAAISVFVIGLTLNIVVPLWLGVLGEFWFFTLIVVSVGFGTAIIRVVQERTEIETGLNLDLAVSNERGRVARDVHDVLGHSLTVVVLKAELVQRLLKGVRPVGADERLALDKCRQEVAELMEVSRKALSEIRSTVGGLRTARMSDEIDAAARVLGDANIELTIDGKPDLIELDNQVPAAWVLREAVTNIVRHSKASHCEVGFEQNRITIVDDGVGLGRSRWGFGLRSMSERVRDTGGSFKITNREQPGISGTLVVAGFPDVIQPRGSEPTKGTVDERLTKRVADA